MQLTATVNAAPSPLVDVHRLRRLRSVRERLIPIPKEIARRRTPRETLPGVRACSRVTRTTRGGAFALTSVGTSPGRYSAPDR